MTVDRRGSSQDFLPPEEQFPADRVRLLPRQEDEGKLRDAAAVRLFEAGIDVERTDGPVFYEMTEDSVSPSGVAFGSEDFWALVRLGRLLAFPAGEREPVQLQERNGDLVLSRPLTEGILPGPTGRGSLWRRLLDRLTGGNQEMEGRDKSPADWQGRREALARLARERTDQRLRAERERYERERSHRREIERRERTQAEREAFLARVEAMTGEHPAYDLEEYRLRYHELAGPGSTGALQTYELPRESGRGGTVVTDRDFTALTLMAAAGDEIGGAFRHGEHPELSEEENRILTAPLWTEAVARGQEAAEDAVDRVYRPARAQAWEAVAAYHDGGDPAPLGQIIAQGLRFFLHSFGNVLPEDTCQLATLSLAGECARLMERDPRLKAAALAALDREGRPLMTRRDYLTAKGMTLAAELNCQNQRAEILLRAEAQGFVTLSATERRRYVRHRVAFAVVNRETMNDAAAQRKGGEYARRAKALSDEIARRSRDAAAGDAQAQARAKRELERLSGLFERFDLTHLHTAAIYTAMGTEGEQAIQELVETQLPGAEKLGDLPARDLVTQLKPLILFAPDSPYREAPRPGEREALARGAPLRARMAGIPERADGVPS